MKRIACFIVLLAMFSCGLSNQEKSDIRKCVMYKSEISRCTKKLDSIKQAIKRIEDYCYSTRTKIREIDLKCASISNPEKLPYLHCERLDLLNSLIDEQTKLGILEVMETLSKTYIELTKYQINLYK